MNVLLTALWPVGGIRTFFRYVYGHEAFSDATFHLLSPDEGLSAYLETHLPKQRIKVRSVPRSGLRLAAATSTLLRRGGFDLVHSHGFSAGVATELGRLGSGTPHLMTAHDVFLPASFRGARGRGKRILLQHVFRRLNGIHAVSEDGAANLFEYLPALKRERVTPILHGIDAPRFAAAEAVDIRRLPGVPAEALVIGFFGRFMAQKGFRTLVDAVEIMVGERLLARPIRVLTFGWGGFIREDFQYIAERGLHQHFLQQPQQDHPEGWIRGVDVVAMPSRWEACGLLAMEALCAGTPIVGTHCIGLREVLSGSPAPMVSPEDPAALAEALAAMAEPGARAPFTAYQPRAAERFSIDRPARALRSLYDEVRTRG